MSGLSPYVRRRLVTEQEAVAATIAAQGPEAAGKFVEEVFWRGYFKGWLERRLRVWTSFPQVLASDLALLDQNRRLRRDVELATGGATGLDCFDAWVKEPRLGRGDLPPRRRGVLQGRGADPAHPQRPGADMIDVAIVGGGMSGRACALRSARVGVRPGACDERRGGGGRVPATSGATHAAARRRAGARVAAPSGPPFLRGPHARPHLGTDGCVGPRVDAPWTGGAASADHVPDAAR